MGVEKKEKMGKIKNYTLTVKTPQRGCIKIEKKTQGGKWGRICTHN